MTLYPESEKRQTDMIHGTGALSLPRNIHGHLRNHDKFTVMHQAGSLTDITTYLAVFCDHPKYIAPDKNIENNYSAQLNSMQQLHLGRNARNMAYVV